MKAFQEAAKVVRGLLDGSVRNKVNYHLFELQNTVKIHLTDTIIDTAKSSIVYDVTKGVSTTSSAVRHNFAYANLFIARFPVNGIFRESGFKEGEARL